MKRQITILATILALAAGLTGASAAQAQTLAACRALTGDAERLACYDRLANGEAAPAPVTPAAESAPPPQAAPSLLGKAWELDPGERGRILRIRPYKPVYILPWFHAQNPNHAPHSPAAGHSSESVGFANDEVKFQISFKSKLGEDLIGDNGDLWFGYTQSSRWQLYNADDSRPFRETRYEPEVMLVWRTGYELLGWRGRFFSLGINHQSNGRSLPLSRSWNRVMLAAAFERDDWTLTVRPWWRIPEKSADDDNPDIANYLGRADVHLVRAWGKQQFSLLFRHNLRGGDGSRGAAQVDYAFPIAGQLRGHLQWFSGYGESLVDYNHRGNYYGVGVSLVEW
ncbi:MAG: phospholipase A [Azonexus sp.]|jgi:phospholipase A1|nr:phospholipase A [Azonexus sp.]